MQTSDNWHDTVEWVGVVVGCVIKRQDKYLLVQEKQAKAHGLWNLPAGHVDKGESLQEAAKRETLEETGYIVKIEYEIAIYHDTATEAVKHAFKATIIGGELTQKPDEILDAKWFTYDEVKVLAKDGKTRSRWVLDAIARLERAK